MNFREAKTEIISVTKRPDKETDTGDAINKAIALAALRNFSADTKEITITIPSTTFIHNLSLLDTNYWTRFRKIKYIRPTGYTKYLTWTDPSKIFNDGIQCKDVWYRSGNGILLNLSKYQSSLEVSYYQYHATLIQSEDTDWMLNEIWPYVKDYALGEIFTQIGDDSEGNKKSRSAMGLLEAFAIDLADGVSYA